MENVRKTTFTATPTLSALLSKQSHWEIVSMASILLCRHFCMNNEELFEIARDH